MKKIALASPQPAPFDLDIDNLLHPAQAFEHPRHVVEDPDLTLNEKRAILASWASDTCAIEATPGLRRAPGTAQPVRFEDVLDALRALNQQAGNHCSPPRYRRILENRIPGVFGRKSGRRRTSGHDSRSPETSRFDPGPGDNASYSRFAGPDQKLHG